MQLSNELEPADTLNAEQSAFAAAYVETGSAIEAYRRAYDPEPGRQPGTMRVRAHQVLHAPKVQNRIRDLNAEAVAQAARLGPAELIARLEDIVDADLSEIISERVSNCRHCHGTMHGYRWTDAVELAKAVDRHMRSLATRKPLPMPESVGGFGFDPHSEPNADCPHCLGDGVRRTVVNDTSKLSRRARALLKSIETKADGSVKVTTHDTLAALRMLAEINGMFVNRNLNLNATVPAGHVTPAQAARMSPDRLLDALGWKPSLPERPALPEAALPEEPAP